MPRRCILVPLDPDALECYRDHLGYPDVATALGNLANAITATPGIPACTLLVSSGDRPHLSLWGELDEWIASRMALQANLLDESLRRLTYFDDRAVRDLCITLAERLSALLGPDRIDRAMFAAIPRGGLNVLGRLAYELDLRRDQIGFRAASESEVTVVVDDVTLTGHRLGQFARAHPGRSLVFAHLLSPPALRLAIGQAEPAVEACVAAADLTGHAPEPLKGDPEEWRDRWLARLEPPRYWVGHVGHVGFPWAEPDRFCWDPEAKTVVTGLKIVPPELCLANRARAESSSIEVRDQVRGKGPLRPSDHVLHLTTEAGVLVADRESGEILELSGSGDRLWKAILATGEEECARTVLLRELDVSEEVLDADLGEFVTHLLGLGILTRDAEGDSRDSDGR